MERYQFQQAWTDPKNPIKTIPAGAVVRSLKEPLTSQLIEQGILKRVADYTRCVKQPLITANACAPLSDEMAAMLTNFSANTSEEKPKKENTKTDTKIKK